MKYVLSGDPIPLARARYTHGRVYNSQTEVMKRCKYELAKQHKKQPLLAGALHLEITFYMPMPASWTQQKKERQIDQPHISRPDWSNLLKFVEDCGSNIIYKDDSLIYSVRGTKVYGWFPKTEFILTEIKV